MTLPCWPDAEGLTLTGYFGSRMNIGSVVLNTSLTARAWKLRLNARQKPAIAPALAESVLHRRPGEAAGALTGQDAAAKSQALQNCSTVRSKRSSRQ
jgi:hypothetical protein